MRISKVKIQNLNSLRLETEIDFDDSLFTNTGLFAIVGNTGAGKTTILDAITLSIYGKVPRHNAPNPEEMMTYGTGTSYAITEFVVKNDRFIAQWSMHRAGGKPDGNFQAAKRQLSQWDEKSTSFKIIAEKKAEMDALVAEITGLDYDRFCKSILLAQGDFAAFLKADKNVRSELLERITGTQFYSEISIAAYQEAKTAKDNLEQTQEYLRRLELLSPEQKVALQDSKNALLSDITEQKKVLQSWQQTQNEVKRWKALQSKLEKLVEENKTIQAQVIQQQADEIALQRHKIAMPIQKQFETWQQQLADYQKLDQQNVELGSKIKEKKEWLEKKQIEKKFVTEEVQTISDEFVVSQKKFLAILPLDEQLKGFSQTLDTLTKTLSTEELHALATLEKTKQISKDIQEKETQLAAFDGWLMTYKKYEAYMPLHEKCMQEKVLLSEYYRQKKEIEDKIRMATADLAKAKVNAEVFQSEKSSLQAKGQQLSTAFEKTTNDFSKPTRQACLLAMKEQQYQWSLQLDKAKRYAALQTQWQNWATQYESTKVEVSEAKAEALQLLEQLVANQTDLAEAKSMQDVRQKQVDWHQTVHKYETDRHLLEDGQPCPLCLSTEHPFKQQEGWTSVEQQSVKDLAEAKQRVHQLEAKCRSSETLQEKNSLLLNDLLGEDRKGENGRIGKLIQEEKLLTSQLEANISSESVTSLDKQLNLLSRNIQSAILIDEDLQVLDMKVVSIEKKETECLGKVTQLTTFIQEQADILEEVGQNIDAKIPELNRYLQPLDWNFDIKEAKDKFQEIEETVQLWKEKIEKKSILVQSIQLLKEKLSNGKEQVAAYEEKIDTQKKEITMLQSKVSTIQNERNSIWQETNPKTFLDTLQLALNTKKSIETSLQDSILLVQKDYQELNGTMAGLVPILEGAAVKTTKMEKLLAISMDESPFKDVSAMLAACKTEAWVTQIKDLKSKLHTLNLQNEQSLKDVQSEIEPIEASLRGVDIAKLEQNVSHVNEKIDQINHSIGQIDQKWEEQAKKEADSLTLQEQWESQKITFNKWQQLNDLIGSAKGDKYRVFAQSLTLQQLTQLANIHLEKLNGRYFVQLENSEELSLCILDTFQANHKRSISSLSGGETFLVSLAMALGLSDLTGRNAQLQSLFIDEGFGSLDAQSLDMTISTLENLQASGKTIGIISHVEGLKERIQTQIRVTKSGDGTSRIEIIG